ncbi:MAG TPA: hypothetical protein VNA04_00470 [Thermoanaerobaculia bacterium]|nr:hypothetical protein [Thermoanaerobaculia bacterium]
MREVRLDDIIGSFGRQRDFNRRFLPRRGVARSRWMLKVGEAYFVLDGHHRISVARVLGAPAIEANVTEFVTTAGSPA